MPTGKYQHEPGVRYGRPPSCICGVCKKCRMAAASRRWYQKRRGEVTDDELEEKLVKYFKERGWD